MKPHLQYAWYVIRHKWFVLRAGLFGTGAPIWRLLIHDWSKFTPAEWSPYVRQFYAKDKREPGAFERAWLHHLHRNAHHWQHWVDIRHDGKLRPLRMPFPLVCEMVADWMGAGRAITGQWEVKEWYEENRDTMILHPDTRQTVEHLIRSL